MTKEKILSVFEDINVMYNNPNMYDVLSKMIDKLVEDSKKSVEPKKKHGKWIGEECWCLPKCSVCGASCFGEHGFDAIKTPYCPTCGAEMEVNG